LEELYLDGCSLDEPSLQSLGALSSLKNLSLRELNDTIHSGGKLTNFNSTIIYHLSFYFFLYLLQLGVCIDFLFYVLATYKTSLGEPIKSQI
jgi:hypothetical protein